MNQPVPDELISAYFDGEVTPQERERVESLLESSAEFRQLLDDTSKLSALLHSFPREAVPAELAVNVKTRVESQNVAGAPVPIAQRPSLRREWTAFGAGMLATMASLIVYVAFNPSTSLNRHPGSGLSVESVERRLSEDSKIALSDADSRHEPNQSIRDVELSSSAMDVSRRFRNAKDQSHPESAVIEKNDAINPSPGAAYFGESVEPPDTREYLSSLSRGDVVLRHIVDPSNVVAVVEFTVVDINKGAEEIELLLKKRDVIRVEDLTVALPSSKAGVASSDRTPSMGRKGSKASDDYEVLYARAEGDRLSDTISETLKAHPELFKSFAPQLPIGVQLTSDANAVVIANGDVKSQDLYEVLSEGTPRTVAAEANLAIRSYNDFNGLSAEEFGTDKSNIEVESAKEFAKNDVAKSESNAKPPLSRRANVGNQAIPQQEKRLLTEKSVKGLQEAENSPQGYTRFHVSVDNQQQVALQQRIAKQAAGVPYNTNLALNNSLTVSNGIQTNNGFGGQWNSWRGKVSRNSTDNRDPRLVRMLIVLKPETPQSTATP